MLPVSMEDGDLFPRNCLKSGTKIQLNEELFKQMLAKMSKIWWSRLVVACRGHLATFFYQHEDTLFSFDDSFIHIHQAIVQASENEAFDLMKDIEVLNATGLQPLETLAEGIQLSQECHPFFMEKSGKSFRRLFGLPGITTYQKSEKQALAYLAFYDLVLKLQCRWKENTEKKKGIRFEEDPEWQPDDRVVIFREFFEGNRTWVLMDFDRHVLQCWRPNGVNVIFGDRYTHSKLEEGFKICSYCGMLESIQHQFPKCPKCKQEDKKAAFYCSKECFETDIDHHCIECHSD